MAKNVSDRTEVINYDKPLLPQEFKSIRKDLANDYANYERIETEKKDVVAGYSEQLKSIRASMRENSKMLTTGKRRVRGECILYPDYSTFEVIYTDKETGEEVFRRTMLPEERTPNMF